MSRGRPEIWIVNEVAVIETRPDTADVISESRQGPEGPKGDTGATGPNAISGSTTTVFNGLLFGNGAAVSVIAFPGGTTAFLRADGTFGTPTASDVGADPSGTATAAMAAHIGAGDPHSQYGLKSGKLSQFAATSSGELAGVLSDETGTGVVVYSTSPMITTPVLSGTVVIRQTGGTAGTDEVQISHDGTRTIIESKDGPIRFRPGGMSAGVFLELSAVTAGTFQFSQIGTSNQIIWDAGFAVSLIRDGVANWWSIDYDNGFRFGQTGGGRTVGLDWAANSVWSVTDGGTFRSIPLTPSQITSAVNNYAPGVARNYRLSSDASRIITGLSVGQVNGLECRVRNSGSNNIVIAHQSASSTAANRFRCETGADITIPPGGRVEFVYDATDSRWDVYPSKTCT